jgi:xanthine dehydrogenase accessory factor
MRDLLAAYERLPAGPRQVGRAVVTSVWGSAPRPEEAFDRIGLDDTCYICVLSHDPKFDEPALRLALRSPAAYIGAIGSRKTQAERRERLAAEGFTPDEIARIYGPIGLDLGGRAPAETALAILAEVTQVRYGVEGEER